MGNANAAIARNTKTTATANHARRIKFVIADMQRPLRVPAFDRRVTIHFSRLLQGPVGPREYRCRDGRARCHATNHRRNGRPLSVSDFHAMADASIFGAGERVELLDGMLVTMPPIGPRHTFAHRFAQRYLELRCGGLVEFSGSSSLILGPLSELQPDLLVLRPDAYDGAPRYWKPGDVVAVIEIPDSSLRYDAGAKSSAYARGGIREYLVIDLASERIIRHRERGPEGFALVDVLTDHDRFSLDGLPGIELDVSGFFGASP